MRLFLVSLTTVFLNFIWTASAFALPDDFESVPFQLNMTVANSETKSYQLDSSRYIKNIVLQAEGVSSDSTIEVIVNGQTKGTVYAPGRDPSYVVTIGEVARSIEFRHRAGGSMRLISMMATVSLWQGQPGLGGGFGGSRDQVRALANTTLQQIEALKHLATADEELTYLFPIKKNAGLVYVMSSSHGNLSKQTIQQLILLMDQIDYARGYLNQLMHKDEAFEPVVNLLTVRETIFELIN